jgi:hypothetical protein
MIKFILATEACNAWGEDFPEVFGAQGPHLGNWSFGEVSSSRFQIRNY